jgi:hypothetical protein
MNAYVKAKRMLLLETAQEFFSLKREKELKERREADRQQLLRWERLQLGNFICLFNLFELRFV